MGNARRKDDRGFEANVMAILDSSGVKESRDMDDDRHSFLQAVRSACLISDSGNAPTRKIFEAIFQILKDDTSLELKMASYQLLCELEKQFPRVYLARQDKSEPSSSTTVELVALEEAWSPFVFGSEVAHRVKEATSRNLHDPFDSHRFFLLTQDISQAFNKMDYKLLGTKVLGDMLLYKYLINVLEGDFVARHTVYKDTMNWALLKASLLHMLLGSRRINFKSLIKDCFSILLKRSEHHSAAGLHDVNSAENSNAKAVQDSEVAWAIGMSEVEKGTCVAVQKFFTLIMELDVIKKEADVQGLISRADGCRTPLLEIILDELTYNKHLLFPFLQSFSDPKWKLEIILQYFWKYCTKPSVRTRRSNSSSDDGSFDNVLKCFSNITSTRNVVRKISAEVAQLLLAHAFQAYLSLEHAFKQPFGLNMNIGGSSLEQICTDMISALNNLKKVIKPNEMMPFEQEALFTAATILLAKS